MSNTLTTEAPLYHYVDRQPDGGQSIDAIENSEQHVDSSAQLRELLVGDLTKVHNEIVAGTITIDTHRDNIDESVSERQLRELENAEAIVLDTLDEITSEDIDKSTHIANLTIAYDMLNTIEAASRADVSGTHIVSLLDDVKKIAIQIELDNQFESDVRKSRGVNEREREARLANALEIKRLVNAYELRHGTLRDKGIKDIARHATMLNVEAIFGEDEATTIETTVSSGDTEQASASRNKSKKLGKFISRRLRKS